MKTTIDNIHADVVMGNINVPIFNIHYVIVIVFFLSRGLITGLI